MSTDENHVPEMLPMLSRGKHRNPRKGACFMELASYLAGERWSDHPDCTHALLASVARLVNDYTSDEARPSLAGLIPSVIGLTSDDPHVDALIALRSSRLALPVVSAERQRVMAVSVLVCERVLAELDGRPAGSLHDESRRVLEEVPHAAEWAQSFTGDIGTRLKGFRRRAAPHAVRCAVDGIARSCVPDPDDRLREVLVQAIDAVAVRTEPRTDRPQQFAGTAWAEACRLTGVAADS